MPTIRLLAAFVFGYLLCRVLDSWDVVQDGCTIFKEAEHSALSQYAGSAGAEYWAWQSQGVDIGGQITALLFEKHASPEYVTLDYGCGSGTVIMNLPASERWCLEVNPLARKAAAENLDAPYRTFAKVDELPNKKFDLIISNHALEHVPCPLMSLVQLRSKLKPGGKVVFYTPSLQDEMTFQKSLKHGDQKYDAADNNHHLYVWSSQQLSNLFIVAGYQIIEAKTKSYSRTAASDAAWKTGGAAEFWKVAESENVHPQTLVVASLPDA